MGHGENLQDYSGCMDGAMDDAFMLYKFKVLPCTRKGAHSWTECAFTHPGEKAARRCPKVHVYSAEACPDARKSGKCARGDLCPYSHGVFEQWLHPSRYRTQLCSFGTACRRPVCFFAHTVQELRVPTACGPNPTALCSVPAPLAGMESPRAVQMRMDVAAAAAAGRENAYMALVQQALMAQMGQAAALHQVDGATATMINRYQAASCAALANAAACQRQQQQHQAAAAAAAAAAIAAAANNPASLLHMAQAAQAYQAAAAAAAAAAANVPMPHHGQPLSSPGSSAFNSAFNSHQMMGSSTESSSPVSSPTCSSNNSNNSSLGSVSTYMDAQEAAGAANGQQAALYDNYFLLQQALAAGGGGNNSPWSTHHYNSGMPSVSAAPASSYMPWLPASSGADLPLGSMGGNMACGGGGYPSGMMHTTPGISDGSCQQGGNGMGATCSLDLLASQLSRSLSLQAYQA